jgi:hypothetical protein
MATATMTELNRRPSYYARLAEREDVYITERGIPRLRISKVAPNSQLERLLSLGLIDYPQGDLPRALPQSTLPRDLGQTLIAEWELDRDEF